MYVLVQILIQCFEMEETDIISCNNVFSCLTTHCLTNSEVGLLLKFYSCHSSLEDLLFELRPLLLQPLFDWLGGKGVSNGLLGEHPHGLLGQTKGGGRQLVLLREIRAEHTLIIRLTGQEEE